MHVKSSILILLIASEKGSRRWTYFGSINTCEAIRDLAVTFGFRAANFGFRAANFGFRAANFRLPRRGLIMKQQKNKVLVIFLEKITKKIK